MAGVSIFRVKKTRDSHSRLSSSSTSHWLQLNELMKQADSEVWLCFLFLLSTCFQCNSTSSWPKPIITLMLALTLQYSHWLTHCLSVELSDWGRSYISPLWGVGVPANRKPKFFFLNKTMTLSLIKQKLQNPEMWWSVITFSFVCYLQLSQIVWTVDYTSIFSINFINHNIHIPHPGFLTTFILKSLEKNDVYLCELDAGAHLIEPAAAGASQQKKNLRISLQVRKFRDRDDRSCLSIEHSNTDKSIQYDKERPSKTVYITDSCRPTPLIPANYRQYNHVIRHSHQAEVFPKFVSWSLLEFVIEHHPLTSRANASGPEASCTVKLQICGCSLVEPSALACGACSCLF